MSQSPHRPSHNIQHRSASAHVDADAACISEIVGETDCAKLGCGVVYRALRDIVCTGCGAPVPEGELFTRWQFRRATNLSGDPNVAPPRLAARCRACVNFADEAVKPHAVESSPEPNVETGVAPDARTSPHRSPLLAHLLAGAGAGASKISTPNENATNDGDHRSPATISPLEAAHEASYKRLAPALNANRRTTSRSGAFRKAVPVKRKF